MKLLIGYPRPDYSNLYAALAGRGFSVVAVADTLAALCEQARSTPCDLVLLWADMAGSPLELSGALQSLSDTAVAVILPGHLRHAEAQVRGMTPAPVAVWVYGVNEADAVAERTAEFAQTFKKQESKPAPDALPPTPDEPAASPIFALPPSLKNGEQNQVLAVWSGSSGGTGKSTVAAEIAHLASSRMQTLLVGLNEPGGVVAGLDARPRADLLDVLAGGDIAVQKRGALWLLPAPSDPARLRALAARGGDIVPALQTLSACYDLTILDLPPALSGAVVEAALGIASPVLYVMRPAAADGAAATRALAWLSRNLPQETHVYAVWNMVRDAGSTGEVQRAIGEVVVPFPEALGLVPYHAGVVEARNRRQLLDEAAADGIVPVSTAESVAGIAQRLLGWEPESQPAYKLPGIRVKVV